MTYENRCYGCMEMLPGDVTTCPRCGYDFHADVENADALPPGTIVAARYLVGRVVQRTEYVLRYSAFDYRDEQKVMVEEVFPQGLSSRALGNTDVSFIEKARSAVADAGRAAISAAQRCMTIFPITGFSSVFDCFEENGTVYTVLAWVDGQPLSQYCFEKRRPWECAGFLRPVVSALLELHQNGLCHGSITPESIYVTPLGNTVLVGLGTFAAELRRRLPPQNGHEVNGYVAPEAQDSRYGDLGPWSDVYSFSSILFELLSGKPLPGLETRLSKEKLPRIPQLNKHQFRSLSAGLALGIDQRQKSPLALYEEFQGERELTVAKKTGHTSALRKELRKKRAKLISGVALAALGILLLVVNPKPEKTLNGFTNDIMPSLVKMDVNEAQERLSKDLSFAVELIVAGKEWDDSVPENAIVFQNPVAGTTIRAGDVVSVYLSRGPKEEEIVPLVRVMPDFTGEEQAYAAEMLTGWGMNVTIIEEHNSTYMKGLVFRQSIEPDTVLQEGMDVTLYVSLGT